MLFSDRTNGDTDDEKKVEGGYIYSAITKIRYIFYRLHNIYIHNLKEE